MRFILYVILVVALFGCDKISISQGKSITAENLESFFRKHKIDGNYAVALKKRSFGESYLATIHGYPDNLSVCQQLIEPYNRNSDLSSIEGEYFCEVLR